MIWVERVDTFSVMEALEVLRALVLLQAIMLAALVAMLVKRAAAAFGFSVCRTLEVYKDVWTSDKRNEHQEHSLIDVQYWEA